jgi:hypothetical protein
MKNIVLKIIPLCFAIFLLIIFNIICFAIYLVWNLKIPSWEKFKQLNECNVFEDSPCGQFVNEKYYYTFVHKIFDYKSFKKHITWGNVNSN